MYGSPSIALMFKAAKVTIFIIIIIIIIWISYTNV